MLNGIEYTNGQTQEVKRIVEVCQGSVYYINLSDVYIMSDLAHVLFIRQNGHMVWRRSENTTYTPDGFVVTRY